MLIKKRWYLDFFNQAIFLLIVQVVFESIKLTKSYQIDSYIIKKNILPTPKYFLTFKYNFIVSSV